MTTYVAFRSSLHALEPVGCKRYYDHEPDSVPTSDLPARILRLPNGTQEAAPLSCMTVENTKTIDFVVLIEPMPLDMTAENFTKTLIMVDEVQTVFESFNSTSDLLLTWDITTSGQQGVQIGGVWYWSVICTVSGKG